MPDATLTQAIKEAYASAPANVVIYSTMELNHPGFTQPIRVVNDRDSLEATLEATAPVNPSQKVLFAAYAFRFNKPEVTANGLPQISLEIDNVDRSIVAAIEQAILTPDPITVIYREFISTDLSAPQNNPPIQLTVLSINATVFVVKATAGYQNFMNTRFPTTAYDSINYPGLVT